MADAEAPTGEKVPLADSEAKPDGQTVTPDVKEDAPPSTDAAPEAGEEKTTNADPVPSYCDTEKLTEEGQQKKQVDICWTCKLIGRMILLCIAGIFLLIAVIIGLIVYIITVPLKCLCPCLAPCVTVVADSAMWVVHLPRRLLAWAAGKPKEETEEETTPKESDVVKAEEGKSNYGATEAEDNK